MQPVAGYDQSRIVAEGKFAGLSGVNCCTRRLHSLRICGARGDGVDPASDSQTIRSAKK
jgi:hypothetical protein